MERLEFRVPESEPPREKTEPKLASKLLADESLEPSKQLASSDSALRDGDDDRDLDPTFGTLVGRDRISDEEYFALQHGAVVDTADREVEFNGVIAPLEQHQRKRLAGPGRVKCLVAFRSHRVAFEALVQEVLDRYERGGIKSPLGLLCTKVSDGEHRLTVVEAEKAEVVYLRERRVAAGGDGGIDFGIYDRA